MLIPLSMGIAMAVHYSVNEQDNAMTEVQLKNIEALANEENPNKPTGPGNWWVNTDHADYHVCAPKGEECCPTIDC